MAVREDISEYLLANLVMNANEYVSVGPTWTPTITTTGTSPTFVPSFTTTTWPTDLSPQVAALETKVAGLEHSLNALTLIVKQLLQGKPLSPEQIKHVLLTKEEG